MDQATCEQAPPQAVLAATDLSDGAALAEARAARLAREQGCALVLLHVLAHDWLQALREWMGPTAGAERVLRQTEATLAQRAEALAAAHGVPVHPCVIEGHPVAQIVAVAQRLQPRCIVVGARGGNPLRRLLLGTTSERLLRKAAHPLLVVRTPARDAYRRVLLPVDFSAWSAPTLALAQRLAPQAAVELLHVYTVPFEEKLRFAGVDDEVIACYRERARQHASAELHALAHRAGWVPSRYQALLHEGDPAAAVVEEAQRRGSDLVIIGKHGRSATEELLLGSVTKHVLAEAPCDVLLSPARADDV
ncbi:Universal stress protein [Tepidimonas alkaliphilus]|uniref:Universal stress protein n=1 Tax=Tepidimonas alkaliphilus TaxID=2588942 RepID=A0A554WDF3_9BURK|nr:universal stress protein [Tepidimonas alkaliphilus]TSE21592.1 Universal stress protein [Tepidimonas alkaliphilus]